MGVQKLTPYLIFANMLCALARNYGRVTFVAHPLVGKFAAIIL
jgi:hypothetical protein